VAEFIVTVEEYRQVRVDYLVYAKNEDAAWEAAYRGKYEKELDVRVECVIEVGPVLNVEER
jgi:hypothetical protein